jgi:hypothetical protein
LNIFAKIGFAVSLQSLVVGLALQTPALASAEGALTLKPAVQVATDEVTLRDLVVDDTVPYENIVICHAPTIGTVRTVSMAEIAVILKKSDEVHALSGPDQISITRTGRKISTADLKPLIEAELKSREGKGTIKDIQLQAAIFVTDVSGLKLRTLRFDSAINKYRAWFVTSGAPHAVSFEAMANLEQGPHDGFGMRNRVLTLPPSPVLAHRGETAAMQLNGEGFTATLMVVCLEDGRASGTIRVREQISKRNYRAQILGAGLLRAVSREN